jgi:hypothetical protein
MAMKPAPKTASKSRRFEYDRMTAEQFRAALAQLDYTPVYFARITGKNRRKVQYWYDGEEDIPHDVLLICSLLTLPGAKEMASTVTNSVIQFYEEEGGDAV